MFKSKYFELGRQIVSQDVSIAIMESKTFAMEIMDAMDRYCRKDWGLVDDEDKALNEVAILEGEGLLGSYMTCKGKIWIITE